MLFRLLLVAYLVLVAFVTLYPFIYVISMSVSDAEHVITRNVIFLPKGINFNAYEFLLQNKMLWTSYGNTIFYTVFGTAINIFMTLTLAYSLSRRTFFLRNPIMMFVTFTMFFNGGMIPNFILMRNLNIYNTRWVMLLPGAISAYNCIIARTFFQSIPDELVESAKICGINDIHILYSIVLPLSMPLISVLTLFYAVGHWNTYFSALIYLPSVKLQPLQVFLVRILIQNSEDLAADMHAGFERTAILEKMRYAAIIVTVLPIICVYPFLQRYFVKGVMLGALKS